MPAGCLLLAAGRWLLAAGCCGLLLLLLLLPLLPLLPILAAIETVDVVSGMTSMELAAWSMWEWIKEERVQRLVLAAIESLDDPIRC